MTAPQQGRASVGVPTRPDPASGPPYPGPASGPPHQPYSGPPFVGQPGVQAGVVEPGQPYPGQPAGPVRARARAAVPTVAPAPAATAAPVTATLLGPGPRRLRLGQVVCWQIAALLVVFALGGGPLLLGLAGTVAAVLILVTALPWRGRWFYQQLALRMGYGSRQHAFTAPGRGGDAGRDPGRAFLDFVAPGTVLTEFTLDDDETVGMVAHTAGLTAVIEIQPDERTLISPQHRTLPALLSMLPTNDSDPLPTTVQLLVQTEPVPAGLVGAGLAPDSYRALSEGQAPVARRCWLAVQAPRTPDFFDDADLTPVLLNAVRRLRRRLRHEKIKIRVLAPADLLAAVTSAARLELAGPGDGSVYGRSRAQDLAREEWDGWVSGSLPQTSYRITRWPTAPGWQPDRIVLDVPASVVTLGLVAVRDPARVRQGEIGVAAVVRIGAADAAGRREAGSRFLAQLKAAGGAAERLDGRQRDGMAATLPLGWTHQSTEGRTARPGSGRVPLDALVATAGGAGLMVGRDRHNQPVLLRVCRAEPTRVAMIGSLAAVQSVVLRLIAVGTRVAVQTARGAEWSRFVQQTGVGPGFLAFVPPGERLAPPGRANRPEVLVVDIGPASWQHLDRGGNGRAVLVVRHEMTAADQDLLVGADLVLMQTLTAPEAALAAAGVGAPQAEQWMTRISSSMVTIASGGVVRWATLNPTDLELRTLGEPNRFPG